LLALCLGLCALGARVMVDQARTALPGDGNYGLKRLSEQASLLLTFNDMARARQHISMLETRLNELVALSTTGRYEDIPPAVDAFRAEIDSTAEALRQVAQHDPARALALVQQVEQNLNQGAQLLATLALAGPPGARPPLQRAIEAAEAGKSILRAQL